MLARVTSAKDGIIEYLENGVKSGRELSRDELDERICIDGNISLTDEIIKQLNKSEKAENYFHITLSFGERDLTEDKIIAAYQEYKSSLMIAFSEDEYNIFAEIHYPKIKSYQNKKTGELVERLPHVHIVIPQKNLVTDKALNPFGKYTDNVAYHDAIQENVNRKIGLESPYDHQRKYGLGSNKSDFISRYKGDEFRGKGASVKRELLKAIEEKNITTMSGFEKEISGWGIVSKGKAGQPDEYLKVMLPGESKNIRLTEPCFKESYIVDRQIIRQKPSDKKIKSLVGAWENRVAHEIKHIRRASPKLRSEYYNLDLVGKRAFLNERIRQYNTVNNLSERGRATGIKPSSESVGIKRFTQISDGLPGMPQRGLVRTERVSERQNNTETEGILSDHANNDMGRSKRIRGNNKLRWTGNDGRFTRGGTKGLGSGGVDTGLRRGLYTGAFVRIKPDLIKQVKPRTLSEQLLVNHARDLQQKNELNKFEVIKKNLDPQRVIDHFEKSHGLVKEHYKAFRVKGGAGRIKLGNRNFTVNDFCTQHMRLSWDDTKAVLSERYAEQLSAKNERQVINSIAFVSRRVTQSYRGNAQIAKLNESIRILKYLQRQERQGKSMEMPDLEKYKTTDGFGQDNTISNADLSLSSVSENFKRQQQIAKKLEDEFSINNLIANKDEKNRKITFVDKTTGNSTFIDHGDKLIMSSRKPDVKDIAAAMVLAAEKFGVVSITGTKEFKRQVIDIAVTKNLNLVFKDKGMNDQFQKQKEEYVRMRSELAEKESVKQAGESPEQGMKEERSAEHQVQTQATANSSSEFSDPVTLVRHGSAPYQNDKNNKKSYFVELSDGEVKWGIGLKDAIAESGAQAGDQIEVSQVGSTDVRVPVEIKDDSGKVIGVEKIDTQRNEWEIIVKGAKETVSESTQADKPQDAKRDDPKEQEKGFEVKYHWSESENKMLVSINETRPENIDPKVLSKIVAKDSFLQQHSIESIRSGRLDMKNSKGVQPVPKTFNEQGDVLSTQKAVNVPKVK